MIAKHTILITTGLVSIVLAFMITSLLTGNSQEEARNAFDLGVINASAASIIVDLKDSQIQSINATNNSDNRVSFDPVRVTERHVVLQNTDLLKGIWLVGEKSSLKVTDRQGVNILKEARQASERDTDVISIFECDGGKKELITITPIDIYLTRVVEHGEAIFIEYDLAGIVATYDSENKSYNLTISSFFEAQDFETSNNLSLTSESTLTCTTTPVYEDVAQSRNDNVIFGYVYNITLKEVLYPIQDAI